MALIEIEPYILDPESECEDDEEQSLLDTQTHRTSGQQNGLQQRKQSYSQHQNGSIVVTLEPEPTGDHVSEPEVPPDNDEEVDIFTDEEDEEGGDKCDASSDEDWVPQTLDEQEFESLKRTSSEEDSEDGEEHSDSEQNTHAPKVKQLCPECGSFYFVQNHTCEHKRKPFVCNVCGKRCVTEFSLKLHCNIHSETYEHYCKYCYKTFKTKLDKRSHEQTHQNQNRPYKCQHCVITFASLKDRRMHVKSHKGLEEYKCDICGLAIRERHKRRHMMIHTGVKPYQCSICQRTFNQAGHLKSHMRLHTGERPYKCQYCDKAFNHNVSLKSHVQRYHPLDSELLDKIYEDLDDIHDGTGGDCGDKEEQDAPQTEKPKNKSALTSRPIGRPKRHESTVRKSTRSKSSKDNPNSSPERTSDSQDSSDGLSDSPEQEVDKAEKKVKRKCRSRNDSDSDFDPNEEMFSPAKRGRQRKERI